MLRNPASCKSCWYFENTDPPRGSLVIFRQRFYRYHPVVNGGEEVQFDGRLKPRRYAGTPVVFQRKRRGRGRLFEELT